MPPSACLSPERLAVADPTEAERAHLAGCVRCRGERRVTGTAPPAPSGSPWVLGRWLGSGGMGVVYEARHTTLGTRHAIKLLRVPDPVLRARLLREGRLQAGVLHPNVVPVEAVVEIDGAPALVMPFVGGPTLAAVLARHHLPEHAAATVFRAVLRGVAEIHRARLVHRDLKPANILLEVLPDEVVPRVSDFGLAKALAASEASLRTGTGAAMGTPAYGAPEQLLDAAAVDPRADVFSLGAVLYELLTGRRAFHGADRDQPPPLDDLPSRWVPVVAACLSMDPAGRPSDAASVLDALPGPEVAIDLRPWCGDGPPTEAPPLALPRSRDRFVGREHALRQLDGWLADGHRFATVVGPGGIGKTRLLLREGWLRGPSFAGGALWVDATSEPPDAAAARVLGDPPERALADRGPMLLLLDGPRAADTAETVHRWLRAAPDLVVLASARTPLGAEPCLVLDGLPPAEAAALFVARAAEGGLQPAAGDPERILSWVARAGGVPLVVELLAARLRSCSLDVLLATPPSPDGWWVALSDAAQSTFAQLSVFDTAFSLGEAESVVDLSRHPDPPWVPDVLQELCDRALLQPIDEAGAVRMRVHEVLREFGAERLADLRHAQRAAESR